MLTLHDKKVWAAGHNGMVGSALCRRLEAERCDILTVDRAALDLRNQQAVMRWMKAQKPDVIIIAAAHVGGIMANSEEPADFLYNNLMIEANIIHAAYLCGVKKLLFLGSSCIYPRDAAQPLCEEALLTGALEPTNEAYALAKISGIKLCESYRKQYGCNFISAMPCNLYGPGDTYHPRRSHVIPALIMKCEKARQENKPSLTIWGTGTPLREFLYVDDLADVLVFLLKHYEGEKHINVGSGQEISIRDLAHMIAELTGYEGRIFFDPAMPDGTPRKLMDSTRLNALGWYPSTSLGEGLAKTWQAYQIEKASEEMALSLTSRQQDCA